jgi:hypothetical protein
MDSNNGEGKEQQQEQQQEKKGGLRGERSAPLEYLFCFRSRDYKRCKECEAWNGSPYRFCTHIKETKGDVKYGLLIMTKEHIGRIKYQERTIVEYIEQKIRELDSFDEVNILIFNIIERKHNPDLIEDPTSYDLFIGGR